MRTSTVSSVPHPGRDAGCRLLGARRDQNDGTTCAQESIPRPESRWTTRLLARLGRYDFELIAPGARQSGMQVPIAELQRFRAVVYREFDALPDGSNDRASDEVDAMAWHIVARLDGALVGCIRATVFEHPLAMDVPIQMLQHSQCTFSAYDRERCLAAIRAFMASRQPLSSPVLQFGGLAVARRSRQTVVAFGLCLGATALTRFLGSAGGVLLAAEKSRTESLYVEAGGLRLGIDGAVLEPLNDAFHRDRILVMGTSPFHNAADTESAVCVLYDLLLSRARSE